MAPGSATCNEKPGIAVVGAGNWGKNLVRVFQELGALAAVCDTDPNRLAALKLERNVRRFHSLGQLLEEPSITALVIATPARTHYELARTALAAGRDVFVEKPLALEKAQGEELVELAESMGRVLMVGHILRFHPAVLKLQELIDRGGLGRLEYIYSNRLNLGRLRTEENILWSFAPHDISVILSLVRERPVAVSAHGAAFLQQQVSDVTVTSIEFPNGIQAHTFVSWLHPFKEQRLVAVGSERMAVFEDSRPDEKLVCYPHRIEWHQGKIPVAVKGEREVIPTANDEPLRLECAHFLECVATRRVPRTDGREGLVVLEVLNAAEESLRGGGQAVRLAPSVCPYPLPHLCGQPVRSANETVRGKASGVMIHPTAVVDEGAEIGPGTKVWHFSHISKGCRIGRNCTIGQNVFVAENVIVGDNCKVQNNVSLYKGVVLEDGVFCGPSCVFTNVIDPRAFIEKKEHFQKTVVRQGATIGANATIVCGITLGRFCLVGAGAVVTRDVPDFALMVGVPARRQGWVCQCGLRLAIGDGIARCRCGASYRLRGEILQPVALPAGVRRQSGMVFGLVPEG